MANEWYRRKSWTKADEHDFFLRLSRARKDGRAQYLKIQAIELMETQDPALLSVAESLLNRILIDFPDDRLERSQTLASLGSIYRTRGDAEKAIVYFEKAVAFEKEFPNVIVGAKLDYAEMVVETGRTDRYDEVEHDLLGELSRGGLIFPAELYTIGSVLAIISAYKGNAHKTLEYATLADQNARAKSNTFWNSKKRHLGLVSERRSKLDELVIDALQSMSNSAN